MTAIRYFVWCKSSALFFFYLRTILSIIIIIIIIIIVIVISIIKCHNLLNYTSHLHYLFFIWHCTENGITFLVAFFFFFFFDENNYFLPYAYCYIFKSDLLNPNVEKKFIFYTVFLGKLLFR